MDWLRKTAARCMDRARKMAVLGRELILYGVFGVLTTLCNIVCYWLSARVLGIEELTSTVIAWVLSVLFAYLTNRTWVFQSRAHGARAITWEVLTFFGGRALSGGMDVGIMALFVKVLGYDDLLVKILSNILVIILNYVVSKWIVFRRQK